MRESTVADAGGRAELAPVPGVSATIFREGGTFIVVDEVGVVRSFVPNASPGGIVDEFLRLGGSL